MSIRWDGWLQQVLAAGLPARGIVWLNKVGCQYVRPMLVMEQCNVRIHMIRVIQDPESEGETLVQLNFPAYASSAAGRVWRILPMAINDLISL